MASGDSQYLEPDNRPVASREIGLLGRSRERYTRSKRIAAVGTVQPGLGAGEIISVQCHPVAHAQASRQWAGALCEQAF
jgi:hypothetical protein